MTAVDRAVHIQVPVDVLVKYRDQDSSGGESEPEADCSMRWA